MTALTIIFAILMFSVIIFVHELGHFMAARIFGVKVLEFSLGMGSALFSKKGKKQTLYSIRAIPIGGFCKMEGEDEDSEKEGSFSSKSRFARFVILAAGATMNIILGFILSIIVMSVSQSGGIVTTTVQSVVAEAPAAAYIKPGDKITRVNGQKIHIRRDISLALLSSDGETFTAEVERGGKTIKLEDVELYYPKNSSSPMLGVTNLVEKPTFFGIVRSSFFETVYMGKVVFVSLGMLLRGEAKLKDLSGPVGVVTQMGDVAKNSGGVFFGFINLLYLAGFISVNIGIMNLLPLPALDGGRIFFILVELIIRRRIPPEKEGIVHFIGLILLFGLMIFVTFNDILRIIG